MPESDVATLRRLSPAPPAFMPRRSLHNPDADLRPAFGLEDDVLEDELRAHAARRKERKQRQESHTGPRAVSDISDEELEELVEDYLDAPVRTKRYSDPDRTYHDWRRSNRLTSTQVA